MGVRPAILIVEDHRDFRQAVKHFLELNKVNARLVEACSGEEGVLLANRDKPKVVIMDYCLRGINGLQAATQIKEHDPKCHIIILTMFEPKDIHPSQGNRVVKAFIGKWDLYEKLVPEVNKALLN